ncbi:MAG TPA: hypothetical protein VFT62_01170 [Mycobacteriales bacterium]|nr:hypothetical protein [Mycobacteriales bacterium]
MGDKPGHYWDFRQAQWVAYGPPSIPAQVEPTQRAEPAPPLGVRAQERVGNGPEADVRSG